MSLINCTQTSNLFPEWEKKKSCIMIKTWSYYKAIDVWQVHVGYGLYYKHRFIHAYTHSIISIHIVTYTYTKIFCAQMWNLLKKKKDKFYINFFVLIFFFSSYCLHPSLSLPIRLTPGWFPIARWVYTEIGWDRHHPKSPSHWKPTHTYTCAELPVPAPNKLVVGGHLSSLHTCHCMFAFFFFF